MRIIPAPLSIVEKEGSFTFDINKGITAENVIKDNISEFFFKVLGVELKAGKDIVFIKKDGDENSEKYIIDISSSRILVTSESDRGLFYGAQTLKQIFFEYFDEKTMTMKLPLVTITDEPRFSYRGFMFDCARHFFSVEVIKRYIDAISILKFNTFHWHLTEDQGWRIEINKYPLLTEVGSKRKETMGDKTPHSGYYTKDDVKEIVEYARDRFITVIPEFDMPAHTRAAIASYPELSCKGEPIDVSTKFGIHSEILCAGNNKTYEFIKDILTEYAEMFPGPYIHIGGDEAIKVEWYKCEKCQNKIKELGLKNEEELQAYLTEQAIQYAKLLGKTVICWNESANSGKLEESAILQFWADGKENQNVLREIRNGRKIIVSKFTPMYLDYPYAMHPIKNLYEFEPMFAGIEKMGDCVLGVESPIWTEWVSDTNKLDYQVFPRLLATAEIGWTKRENKDYHSFMRAVDGVSDMLKIADGITKTPAKKCNPKKYEYPYQMIKFGIQMLDFEMINRSRIANKEMKKMRALRNKEEK